MHGRLEHLQRPDDVGLPVEVDQQRRHASFVALRLGQRTASKLIHGRSLLSGVMQKIPYPVLLSLPVTVTSPLEPGSMSSSDRTRRARGSRSAASREEPSRQRGFGLLTSSRTSSRRTSCPRVSELGGSCYGANDLRLRFWRHADLLRHVVLRPDQPSRSVRQFVRQEEAHAAKYARSASSASAAIEHPPADEPVPPRPAAGEEKTIFSPLDPAVRPRPLVHLRTVWRVADEMIFSVIRRRAGRRSASPGRGSARPARG